MSIETTRTHRHPLSLFQEYSQSSCTKSPLWWLIWTLKTHPKHYQLCSINTSSISDCSRSSMKANASVQNVHWCLCPNSSSQSRLNGWMLSVWAVYGAFHFFFMLCHAAVKDYSVSTEQCSKSWGGKWSSCPLNDMITSFVVFILSEHMFLSAVCCLLYVSLLPLVGAVEW